MTSTEEKLEIPSSSSKLLEPKEKTETPEKKEKQFLPNFPFYYILVLLFIYSSSLFLTASNVKFGKPVLVHNNELKSDIGNFRFLENVNENKTNFELYSKEKNMKLNFKDHIFLIMTKKKKKIYPTIESALGCLIKFGLNAINIFVALFGRFFDKKFI